MEEQLVTAKKEKESADASRVYSDKERDRMSRELEAALAAQKAAEKAAGGGQYLKDRATMKALRKKEEELTAEVASAKEDKAALEKERAGFEAKHSSVVKERDEAQRQLKRTQERAQQANQSLLELQQTMQNSKPDALQSTLEAEQARTQQLAEERDIIAAKLEAVTAKAAASNKELLAMQEKSLNPSGNKVVKALEKRKKELEEQLESALAREKEERVRHERNSRAAKEKTDREIATLTEKNKVMETRWKQEVDALQDSLQASKEASKELAVTKQDLKEARRAAGGGQYLKASPNTPYPTHRTRMRFFDCCFL